MRYKIHLRVDTHEWDYLRVADESGMWSSMSPVRIFNTLEEAKKEALNWNTAEIVEIRK